MHHRNTFAESNDFRYLKKLKNNVSWTVYNVLIYFKSDEQRKLQDSGYLLLLVLDRWTSVEKRTLEADKSGLGRFNVASSHLPVFKNRRVFFCSAPNLMVLYLSRPSILKGLETTELRSR